MSKITESIRYVGVNDCINVLFEGLWPLPFGISYNSYLVMDRKIALIDTVGAGFEAEYLSNIRDEIGDRVIDYLIVNHCEPDHTSMISLMMNIYPGILIVTNSRAVPMLKGYYGLGDDDILVVRDGDRLNLGTKSLSFHMTPMLHWPETMMTWLSAEHTLFSGDVFGSFGALTHGVTDTEYRNCSEGCGCQEGMDEWPHYSSNGFSGGKADAYEMYRNEMIRYYSNIIGKYGAAVQTALKHIGSMEIGRICSTHGPVWENQTSKVIGLYDSLSRYEAEHGVCIAYGSMYGNTGDAAGRLADTLSELGIPYALHDLTSENISAAIRDVFRYDTLAIGSPTYNGGIFPPIESFIHAISSRMVRHRRFFAFGSYTWAGASVRMLNEFAHAQGFDVVHEGISFAQACNNENCDMNAPARLIANKPDK